MTTPSGESRLVTEGDDRVDIIARRIHMEDSVGWWGPGTTWRTLDRVGREKYRMVARRIVVDLDGIARAQRFTLGPDLLRDHMTGACEKGCPYCAKRQRIRTDLLEAVAHRAFHLLDDGGEVPDEPDDFIGSKCDANLLSDALDALEADGWNAHEDGSDA